MTTALDRARALLDTPPTPPVPGQLDLTRSDMTNDRIVLDQSKIRISEALDVKPGAEFPRTLAWWQRYVPLWLDASLDSDGHVVLEPNGRRADGSALDATPALRRRRMKAAERWMDNQIHLDFTNAIARPTP
ncbi:hypothetical protein ABZ172_04925 [Streptomyces sp. NPDC006296]|uniref:hypothetical protein n=1 Tax=Streptomyces sp. NPDC006296 TaxID=3156746 RepID=UPI0033AC90D1